MGQRNSTTRICGYSILAVLALACGGRMDTNMTDNPLDGGGAKNTLGAASVGGSTITGAIAMGGSTTTGGSAAAAGALIAASGGTTPVCGATATETGAAGAPITVAGTVSAIASGAFHTCALVESNVWCWGSNEHGQLGNGTTVDSHVPIQSLASGVTALAAGQYHTCALVSGGVQCWGSNLEGQLGNDHRGAEQSEDGNYYGLDGSTTPAWVQGLTSGVVAIAAGMDSTCALTTEGGVKCWGWNEHGQLGNGSADNPFIPVQVENLTSEVTAITVGGEHACAIAAGKALCWGSNHSGQLGNRTPIYDSFVPVQVLGLASNVSAISAGGNHTCALHDGAVECWGRNYSGELGDGSTTERIVPVRIGSAANAKIRAASAVTCAAVDGRVLCWGDNSRGQLGNCSKQNSLVPVQVWGLASGVTLIDRGCALVYGAIMCWGANDYGRLGNGSTSDGLIPTEVRFP